MLLVIKLRCLLCSLPHKPAILKLQQPQWPYLADVNLPMDVQRAWLPEIPDLWGVGTWGEDVVEGYRKHRPAPCFGHSSTSRINWDFFFPDPKNPMVSSDSGLGPSIPPPAGHQPNFANPECDRNAVYIPLSICTGVATIFFFARTFTKRYIMKRFDVEDCESSEDSVLHSRLIGVLICSPLVGYYASPSESGTSSNTRNQMFELGFETSAYLRLQCGLSCHQWDLTTATMSCFHFVRHTLTKHLSKLLTDSKATLHQQHPLCSMHHFPQAFNPLPA